MYFLKLSATLKIIKPKKIEVTQGKQEVDHTAEKKIPVQDVRKNEDIFEQHIILSYEDEAAPPGKPVLSLSEVYDEEKSQRDKTSDLKGTISFHDNAKKETKLSKSKLVRKTQEATAVVAISTLPDKLKKERTEEKMVILERKQDSLNETNIEIETQKYMSPKAESKERQVREQDIVKPEEGTKDRGSVVKIDPNEPPVIISSDTRKQSKDEKIFTAKSVKHDDHITSTIFKQRDGRVEQVTEVIKKAEKVPAKDWPAEAAPSQMKEVTESMSRIVQTQIQPMVITETLPEDLLLTKPEAAQQLKSDVTVKKKVVAKAGGSLEEKSIQSTTDVEMERPKVIQQDPAAFSTKPEGVPRKGEKNRSRPPQEPQMEKVVEKKSLVPLKAAEKKRTSPQTAARGIKRMSKLLMLVPLHILFFHPTKPTLGHLYCPSSCSVYFYVLPPHHLHTSLFCYCLFFPNELFFSSFFLTKHGHVAHEKSNGRRDPDDSHNSSSSCDS